MHISTGDIFRDEIKKKTALGKKVERILKGQLVPDYITNKILKERIEQKDCKKGFILDGYPRTISQIKFLDKITKIDAIINLDVPDWVIIKRTSAREVCKKCGEIYNKLTLKSKKKGICNKCGGELYQRKDDIPKLVKKRLEIHKKQIEPLLKYYKKQKANIVNIKCNQIFIPPENVVREILKGLKPFL